VQDIRSALRVYGRRFHLGPIAKASFNLCYALAMQDYNIFSSDYFVWVTDLIVSVPSAISR
jgi:hypothetical protein